MDIYLQITLDVNIKGVNLVGFGALNFILLFYLLTNLNDFFPDLYEAYSIQNCKICKIFNILKI